MLPQQQQQQPSPARLGLTNPTSPSNPNNPTPSSSSTSSKPQPSSNNPNNHPNVSPSILPLLPPLPRSHSLLLQLSSLSSNLFDLSPHRSLFLNSYRGSLPTFLSQPPTQPPSTSLNLLPSLHSQLLHSVSHLQSILDLHHSITTLSSLTRSLDSTLLTFARKMAQAHSLLHLLLHDYSHYRHPSSPSSSSFSSPNIPVHDILSYAHRISYTTFAPPEFASAGAPLRGALPPAPQDEQMRASQLYNFAALNVGAGTVGPVVGEGLMESFIEPTPPREDANLPAIAVPAGWRKGMPVDLLKDLPPLPPGWKPGDPIQLPPIEAFGGNGRGEEHKVAGSAVVQPRLPSRPQQQQQPETIQVKYVQLDINPEDDYSSDYSSEGSSDEDDED